MAALEQSTVLVVSQLPPPLHGSTIITSVFLSALSRLGIEAHVIDKRFSREMTDIGKLRARKLLQLVQFYCRVMRSAASHRRHLCVYFLTVSPSSFLVDYIAVLILRLGGIRVVPYLHGIGYTRLAGRGSIWRKMVGDVFRSAAAVVICGSASRQDIAEWLDGQPEFVIPNTLPDPDPLSVARPAHHEGLRCVYLSTIARVKGAADLLEAARQVVRQRPDAEFFVAGQISSELGFQCEFEAAIKTAELGCRFQLVGPVSEADKQELLSTADVFVFPSHHECFPLVVLEAMRMGLPIIATRVGSTAEQIEDGESGYLVPARDPSALANKILELLNDERMREHFKKCARLRYGKLFSPEMYEARWRTLFESLGVLSPKNSVVTLAVH